MSDIEQKLEKIRAAAAAAPIAQWLGFSATCEGDEILYGLAFNEHHIGNVVIRALHGGAIAAFLEFTAQSALTGELEAAQTVEAVNADIDYLRSTRDTNVTARATVLRAGRRIAFVETTAWQDDPHRPFATGRFRFSLTREEASS